MKYLYALLVLATLTAPSCEPENSISGSRTVITQLAIYNFDVAVEPDADGDLLPVFTASDSTIILQLTRTQDLDISTTGDERNETILIVIDRDATSIDLSGSDWDDVKSFAFLSETAVTSTVARITGGTLRGDRLAMDNSWILFGEVELSADLGNTFPTVMDGTYASR